MIFEKTIKFLEEKFLGKKPEIALITGTGLDSLIEIIENQIIIPYSEIPNFPVCTAPLHTGELILGEISGTSIVILRGRLHLYEGYSAKEITFPIKILKLIGIKILIQTNASGSLRKDFSPGDIVILEDHINFMGTNPLIGKNEDKFGERFPSLHDSYDSHLREQILNISNFLKKGIYIAVSGPSLETKAECRMFQRLGADIVGMSTVPETIAAVHCGIKVVALSVVTNYSNLFHEEAHSLDEMKKNATKSEKNLKKIILNIIGLQKKEN